MNKSAESERSPAELLLTGIDWYRGGRKGGAGGHGEPLFTDHLLTLSKDLACYLKLAGGVLGVNKRTFYFFKKKRKKKKMKKK